MRHYLRYGEKNLRIELPDQKAELLSLAPVEHADEKTVVKTAIRNSSLSLDDFLASSSSVALVISDQTRNTGSKVYIPILLDALRKKSISVTIIVALGLHRQASKEEIQDLLGIAPDDSVRVINHDAESELLDFGGSQFNAEVVQAERVIITGSVTFHPMAGFSGGWKSLLPGLASKERIIENHRLFFDGDSADPRVGPASIEGNPILRDIRQRTRIFDDKTWCLNVVQDEAKNIVFASAGKVDAAWSACVDYLNRHNAIPLRRKYSVVVASSGGYPADFSFYQSMKTLTNASRACEIGGKIFLLMECKNGWELEADTRALASLELHEIARAVRQDFSMSGLAMYMALSIIRKHDVFCFSALPKNEVSLLGMTPISSTDEIGRLAVKADIDKIAVMPAAASVLPRFIKEEKDA